MSELDRGQKTIGGVFIAEDINAEMEPSRFDELSKALATGALSRRTAGKWITAMGAAAAGAIFGRNGAIRAAFAQASLDSSCNIRRENEHQIFDLSVLSVEDQLRFDLHLDIKSPPANPTPDACLPGFVWREALPTDHVCVAPVVRTQTANDNFEAPRRRNPAGGPFGVDTCQQGFVFREAVPGDHVCVTPQVRQQAVDDNAHAQERRQGGALVAPSVNPPLPVTTTSRNTIGRQGALSPPLVVIDTISSATGFVQRTVEYGEAFRGIKRAQWTTRDGKVFVGVIDGKPTKPFRAETNVRSIQMADGSPLSTVTIDGVLEASITRLLNKARSTASSCTTSAHTRSGVTTFDLLNTGAGACNKCDSVCGTTSLACQAGAAGLCIITFGVGCGAAATIFEGCISEFYVCYGTCRFPGEPCCPTFCPGMGDICCDEGNTCVDNDPFTRCCPPEKTVCDGRCCDGGESCFDNTCCRSAEQACNGVCCPAGQHCADRNQKICCSNGSGPICGTGCCPSPDQHCADASRGLCCGPGQVELGGGCCASGSICGTVCCENGTCLDHTSSNCCSGLGVTPCGAACCDPGSLCVRSGVCCPRDQACGSICCPAGQVCSDPRTGTCKASDCPPGQVHTSCQQTPLGGTTTVCCAPGSICCAGHCCPSGQLCCVDPITNVFGCSSNCLH